MEAIAAQAILPQRIGVLVHDCWSPYWQLPGMHALCNAHLLRELLYVQELTGERWPARMSELLLRTNELCEAARRKDIVLGDADKAALRTFCDAILSEGERRHPARLKPTAKAGRVKQSVAFNLLLRLRRYADAVLLFVADPALPFTNNLGERAIRMPKVKQKISGSFRTLLGAQNFRVIRTCLDTLRKQGHGMFTVLQRAFAGNPIQPTPG